MRVAWDADGQWACRQIRKISGNEGRSDAEEVRHHQKRRAVPEYGPAETSS